MATRRCRNREGYFKRNFGDLPWEVQQYYRKADTTDKTKLINQIIQRSTNGQWSINLQTPIVMQCQEKNVERRKEKGLITKPSGRAACMWGGWDALNCALQSKQVWKVEIDNQVFYQWRECNEGQIESHRGGMQTTGRRVLNQREYNEINGFLAQFQWQLDLSYAEAMGTDAGTGEHPPPLPDKILSNLNKVQKACDQAISEAKMHVRQLLVLATKLADQSSSVIAADLQKALEATPCLGLGLGRQDSRGPGILHGTRISVLDYVPDPVPPTESGTAFGMRRWGSHG